MSTASEGFWDAINQLELPLFFIDLEDFTILAESQAAATRLGVSSKEMVGRSFVEFLFPPDQDKARVAMRAMQLGAVDLYRAHRRVGAPLPSRGRPITTWVRAFHFADKSIALAEAAYSDEQQRSPLAEYFGQEPLTMVVGTTNVGWDITSVSTNVNELLGVTASEVVGSRFLCSVEHGDVRRVLQARGEAAGIYSVALRVRLRTGAGEYTPLCCVLTSLAGTEDLLFILMPEPELSTGAMRAAKLEQALARVAAEVEASGVLHGLATLPDSARVGNVIGLTRRQWEVLRRLLGGERVPTIARALFISQSTVRNHLAAIFEHFDVHSQAELLERLRSEMFPRSP